MESQRSYKLTMFIKKKPEMTEADFHDYWSHKHVPIVNAWLANHGVIRYTQYHTPSEHRKLSERVWTGLGGDSVLDFDGVVELVVPDIECLERALEDPVYEEKVKPDEEKFIDGARSFRTYGWEEHYIVDNKALV